MVVMRKTLNQSSLSGGNKSHCLFFFLSLTDVLDKTVSAKCVILYSKALIFPDLNLIYLCSEYSCKEVNVCPICSITDNRWLNQHSMLLPYHVLRWPICRGTLFVMVNDNVILKI